MTRVGIIVCDHYNEQIAEIAGGDVPDRYRHLLGDADPGLEFREFDAVRGELPTDLGECDAWIVTGSRADAHGDEPWVVDLLEWIRWANDARERLAGICFGHQAVAQALGGAVERGDRWRMGPQRLTVDATPWFGEQTVALNAMHRDVVTELPPEAEVIGSGETAQIPAFRLGDHVLCVQDHPEFDNDLIRAIIEMRRPRLGDELADDASARVLRTPTDGDVVGCWLADFLADRRRT
jgi:GMP synthase-like glutamine amidotransferase